MSETERGQQSVPVELDRIDLAVRKATREAVLTHARMGRPVCTLRDGKVVWLSPDEIFAMFASEPPATLPTSSSSP
jgi:hypothetical protein